MGSLLGPEAFQGLVVCRISQILFTIIPKSKGKKGFGAFEGLFNKLELGVIVGKNLMARIRVLTVYVVSAGRPSSGRKKGILRSSGGVWLCNRTHRSRIQNFLRFWEALWIFYRHRTWFTYYLILLNLFL